MTNTLIIILMTATGMVLIVYDGMTQDIYNMDIGLLSLFGGGLLGLAWILGQDN